MIANIPKYSSDLYIPIVNACPVVSNSQICNQQTRLNSSVEFYDQKHYSVKKPKLQTNVDDSYSIGSDIVPWKRRNSYSPGVIGLHEEINDFYNLLSPIAEETEIRQEVVNYVKQIVHSLWPLAKVEVFGSFRTGLLLPTSDIDIVVTGKWQNLPLSTLKTALINSGTKESDITVLATASVPIVKFVHSVFKVKVDISFNAKNGVKSAKMIKEFMELYPALPKLVIVLKQFLLNRGLNEVYTGGMSSYTLTLLVISLLQGHHKPKSMATTNLGTLLMEFFELYGINFNYKNVCICVQNGGSYKPKQCAWESYLSVKDPHAEENDVAKGTFLMNQIQKAFENAYYTLHKSVALIQPQHRSTLQLIVDVDNEVFKQRQWLRSKFGKFPKMHSPKSGCPELGNYPPSNGNGRPTLHELSENKKFAENSCASRFVYESDDSADEYYRENRPVPQVVGNFSGKSPKANFRKDFDDVRVQISNRPNQRAVSVHSNRSGPHLSHMKSPYTKPEWKFSNRKGSS